MSTATRHAGAAGPARAPLRHNVLAMYALQIANYAIPLVTLPYLIRVLGAEGYGAMAAAYAVVFFMVLFVDAGTNTLATRRLARPQIDLQSIRRIFAATQWIKLVQCAAMAVLLLGLIRFVPAIGEAKALYLATLPLLLGSLLFPTWLFQGLEVMHFTTVCSVGGRLLATLAIFACVREPGDVVIAALLQASATALSGLLALPLLFGRVGVTLRVPQRRLYHEIRRTLSDARALAPAEFLTHAVANSGVFVLGLFANDAAVGVYAAVEKVARAGASVFQPLTKALFPGIAGGWMTAATDTGVRCRAWTRRILLLAVLAAGTLWALAPWGLETMFGPGWAAHATLLRLLAVWLVASVAATVVGQFWLLARGDRRRYTLCLLGSGLVQLGASLVAAQHFGAHGLVGVWLAAELIRLSVFALATRRPDQGVSQCAS